MSEVLPLPLPWRTVTNDRRVSVLAANGLVVTEIFGTAFYDRKQEIADMIVDQANRPKPQTTLVFDVPLESQSGRVIVQREPWEEPLCGPCSSCVNGTCVHACAETTRAAFGF